MIHIDESQFRHIVTQAIDAIPEKYGKHIDNVAFIVEDEPGAMQREKLRLQHNQSLFGLYEGVPLVQRGANYNLVLPDKITIFRLPILWHCNTYEEVLQIVKTTVWHEVAHYYGLSHAKIKEIEDKKAKI